MSITTTNYVRSDLVKMTGRVDTYTAADLEKAMNDLLENKRYNIVFDMDEVDFLSSKGLRVLTETHIQAKDHGGKLVLANTNPKIRESFEWVGMADYFEIYDNVTSAVGSF